MSKPMVRIVELDGTVIDREMTNEEHTQYQISLAEVEARKAEAEAKAQAKADLLERLGITEQEARLLLS